MRLTITSDDLKRWGAEDGKPHSILYVCIGGVMVVYLDGVEVERRT